MEEEWRPVVGYEGSYEVSNLGRVKSLKRKSVREDRILKGQVTNQGYSVVSFRHYRGSIKMFKVHRLVLSAFVENVDNLRTVNHKNGIKGDNRLANLEWLSYKDNLKHARELGLSNSYAENHHRALLSNEDVGRIKQLLNIDILTQVEIGRAFRVSEKLISEINVGTTWRSVS